MKRLRKRLTKSFFSGSVMHYPKGAFAVNPSIAVIKAKTGNPVLGQRSAFSAVRMLVESRRLDVYTESKIIL